MGLHPYREKPEADNDDRLPWHELSGRGIANLVKLADRNGHYVTALGAERFQIATMRGRIVLRSATYDQAILFLETGEVIEDTQTAYQMAKSRRIAFKQRRLR